MEVSNAQRETFGVPVTRSSLEIGDVAEFHRCIVLKFAMQGFRNNQLLACSLEFLDIAGDFFGCLGERQFTADRTGPGTIIISAIDQQPTLPVAAHSLDHKAC